jgi:hypothetical protein
MAQAGSGPENRFHPAAALAALFHFFYFFLLTGLFF